MAIMTSFLPVNNGLGGPTPPPTEPPTLDRPKEPAPLPTSYAEPQSPGKREIASLAEINEQSNGAHTTSVAGSQSSTATAGTKTQSAADGSSVHSDGQAHESDGEQDGSDNGVDAGDSAPPSKKKKGQRFFCTDFPPCNLSFTRSEHLARHIRKHTGERPFQCHCSRRFSRLDNLRQHAQTVHVNEDIPGDSLAATVTRVQRQIRTDRIRPPGRARAGTGGSQSGAHSRGHSRNLSASSVPSNVSSYSQAQDLRRRPPPLIMAHDPSSRAKLSVDTMASPPKTPPSQVHAGFTTQSPGTSFYTPSSANYSAVPGGDHGSPYFTSPASSSSGFWGDRGTPRRLSFPTGVRPFDMPQPGTYPPPYRLQEAPQPNASFLPSPSSANTPQDGDSDWRRRTWHPSSPSAFARPATSGLWFSQTSSENQQAASDHPTRLPGIESFDRVQQRPSTPPRREPTPMQVDQPKREVAPVTSAPSFDPQPRESAIRSGPPISGSRHRRGNVSIDTALQRTLTKLDLHGNGSKDSSHWEAQAPVQRESVTAGHPFAPSAGHHPSGSTHSAPGNDRRQSWVDGAMIHPAGQSPAVQTINQDTSKGNSQLPHYLSLSDHQRRHSYVPPEYLPKSQPTQTSQSNVHTGLKTEPNNGMYPSPEDHKNGMGRLEALVAVATSERKNQFP